MCQRRTLQAFFGWPQYVMLAGASVTMLFAEVLAFEGIILMAGYLPQPTAQVFSVGDPCPDHDSWWPMACRYHSTCVEKNVTG